MSTFVLSIMSNPRLALGDRGARVLHSHSPRMRPFVVLALLAGCIPALAPAQQGTATPNARRSGANAAPPRAMRAVRRNGPITLDGKLDEAAWAQAPVSGDFVQSYPAPNVPAPDRTEVRVLYDDDALYIGVRMFDPHPDSIAAGLAHRDAGSSTGIYTDWIRVGIDSYHDRRTAFEFSASPRGVQNDSYISNDTDEDVNWDAIWEVGTRIDSAGWVAEYRIPLSQLRFGADSGPRVWGFQVQRDIARRKERDSWAPWTPDGSGFASFFGDISGIEGIPVVKRLEVVPYVSSTFVREAGEPGDPFHEATRTTPKVGADIKYGLPRGLTLSATINPDFGQVEVDPAVVNLSAFEVSFPEKRPFFLEGSDVFSFGQVVRQNDYGSQTYLYSRRIGREPQLGLPNGTLFADVPNQTTIAGAAKITGRSGPWTVGILDAVTTEQRARLVTRDTVRAERPVEPLTNYFAGRLKRDFRGGATTVGAMLQQTTRAVGDTVFTPYLRSGATFGGVDFEHDMAKRRWIVSGFAGGSLVRGSAQAIAATQGNATHNFRRPDAPYLTYDSTRTTLGGYITEFALQKNGSVFGSVAVKATSPGLELNDLGFQSRTGFRSVATLIGKQSFTATKHLRDWSAFVYQNDVWNYGDRPIYHGYAGQANATFPNFWSGNVGLTYSPKYYDDQLLRGGPEGAQPTSTYANASLSTDSRKPIRLDLSASYALDVLSGYSKGGSIALDMRPSSNIHINFGPSFTQLYDTEQYRLWSPDPLATRTYGRRYVLAALRQNTLSLDTRMDVTFTPRLSFVMYAQPFVSAGRYNSYKEFLAPGQTQFHVYDPAAGEISYNDTTSTYTVTPDGGTAPSFTFGQPNFNVRSLRGNAVLRWDYRPGSSFYVVWQQERSDFLPIGEFETRRDVGAIFRTVPRNVFLIKATYWLGL